MDGFGLFSINDSFAEDNLSVSGEDSEAYKKQLENPDFIELIITMKTLFQDEAKQNGAIFTTTQN